MAEPKLKASFKSGAGFADGRWSVEQGKLVFRSRGNSETASLQASIVATHPQALVVGVSQRQSDGRVVSRTLELKGEWLVDSANRLSFLAERQTGESPSRLLFRGEWMLGRDHSLAYRLSGGRKDRKNGLTFSGFWDVVDGKGLSYVLEKDGPALRLRGAFQSRSVLAKTGEIRYQLGVESRKGPRSKTLVFFGKWKVSQVLALEFELDAPGARRQKLSFGAAYEIDPKNRVRASLFASRGEPLGLEVVLERDVFGRSGKASLLFRKMSAESRVEASFSGRW